MYPLIRRGGKKEDRFVKKSELAIEQEIRRGGKMKVIRLAAICCLAVMLSLSISGYLGIAEAQVYEGNLCFSYSCGGGVTGFLELGYFYLGDTHFLLSGTFIQNTPVSSQGIFHGNAELLGFPIPTTLESTLIYSSSSPSGAAIETLDFVTDLATLTGTLKGILTGINTASVTGSVFVSCTTDFIGCP
jgi:hypothetical protein